MKFPHLMLHIMLQSALVLSLALGGCGDGGKKGQSGDGQLSIAAPKQAEVDDTLASLVPSNAVAMIYVSSAAKLESSIKTLMGKIDPGSADGVDLSDMVGPMLMGQGALWDKSKPMAIAMALPPEGADMGDAMQGAAMIFGMTDAAAAKTAMEAKFKDAPPEERPTVTVAGNYLTVSGGAGAKLGGSKLAASAPDGDVGLRIDLAAIVARYRKDIDAGMDEMQKGMDKSMGSMPPGAAQFADMFKGIAGKLRDFVDSAETLDIAMSVDGDNVDLSIGFTAKAGSKLDVQGHDHSSLAAMAGLLPEGMPINLLMSMDLGAVMNWMKPLMQAGMDAMPDDQKAKFQAYMDETTEMTKLLGPNVAVAMGFGENGMELVEVLDCKDTATYIQRVDKLFASDILTGMPGIAGQKTGTTQVAGVDVHTYGVTLDLAKLMSAQGQTPDADASAMASKAMKALFGGEQMSFHMAALDNKLLFTMGAQAGLAQVIEAARSGGKAPSALQQAIDRAGGKPTFVLQMDARKLARQVVGLVKRIMGDDKAGEKMPEVPAGKPVPILVWGKHDGRVYGGGLRLDVGGIAGMVEAMGGK